MNPNPPETPVSPQEIARSRSDSDGALVHKIFIDLIGQEFDPARPDGYVQVKEMGSWYEPDGPWPVGDGFDPDAPRRWVPFPALTLDLNEINKLEQQTVYRLAGKRKVFRERLVNLCGDTVLHASARNRTLALSQALEILANEAKSNTHS